MATRLKSKLEIKLEWSKLMDDHAVLRTARWMYAQTLAEDLRDMSKDDMARKIIDGTMAVPKTGPRLFEHLWHAFGCDNDRDAQIAPDEQHNRVELLEFGWDAVRDAAKEKDARGNK